MKRPHTVLTALLAFAAGAFTARAVDPTAWTPMGYTFELTVEVPVTPEVAWDHFTGDVSGWWDHHFTAKPAALTIGRQPGSSFLEVFDAQGHGAEHARVTHAIRGKMLRLVGPLGLVGEGIVVDSTLHFAAEGDGTTVKLVAHLTGKVGDTQATLVERVWRHFLVEQYVPWVQKQ